MCFEASHGVGWRMGNCSGGVILPPRGADLLLSLDVTGQRRMAGGRQCESSLFRSRISRSVFRTSSTACICSSVA